MIIRWTDNLLMLVIGKSQLIKYLVKQMKLIVLTAPSIHNVSLGLVKNL